MEFSTAITQFDRSYNFDTVGAYNKYLSQNSSFQVEEADPLEFELALQRAAKNYPVKDKDDPEGLGNFASKMGNAFSAGLDSVNSLKIEAERLQEDIAMGGSTNIHDAMIAAEKASLSMQMAIQVRNRLISAYNEITGMSI